MPKLTKYDKLIIVFFLVVSIVGFMVNVSLGAQGSQKYVTVHVDNELVAEISFNELDERIVTIPFGDNKQHEAKIEIKDGKVRMLPISKDLCPEGICSHTGWISRDYETIVCLPNRIVVSFAEEKTGVDDKLQLDGITY